jgi:hypothetical protein
MDRKILPFNWVTVPFNWATELKDIPGIDSIGNDLILLDKPVIASTSRSDFAILKFPT